MSSIKLFASEVPMPGKGPGLMLYGDWVTPEIHDVFVDIMRANHIDSEEYKARIKCAAFFQGGYGRPNDRFIFIEFMKTRLGPYDDYHEDFMKIVNDRVVPLIDIEKWKIAVTVDAITRSCTPGNNIERAKLMTRIFEAFP